MTVTAGNIQAGVEAAKSFATKARDIIALADALEVLGSLEQARSELQNAIDAKRLEINAVRDEMQAALVDQDKLAFEFKAAALERDAAVKAAEDSLASVSAKLEDKTKQLNAINERLEAVRAQLA